MHYVAHGSVHFKTEDDSVWRLKAIFESAVGLIRQHQVVELAIEAPYYGKNVQSMLKLGRAQGVVMAAALSEGLNVHEYAPRLIKQSITGRGNASKEQVAGMLNHLLKMPNEAAREWDATDALAVGVCHVLRGNSANSANLVNPNKKALGSGKKSSWGDFIKNHPDRLG